LANATVGVNSDCCPPSFVPPPVPVRLPAVQYLLTLDILPVILGVEPESLVSSWLLVGEAMTAAAGFVLALRATRRG
jgi:hypothetical protein